MPRPRILRPLIAVGWGTEDGIRGFLVPRGTRGFTARSNHKKLSLRASVASEPHSDEVTGFGCRGIASQCGLGRSGHAAPPVLGEGWHIVAVAA